VLNNIATPNVNNANIVAGAETYACNVEPPTSVEVLQAIARLKNNKAAGEDGIPAELYKAASGSIIDHLTKLISEIWHQELIPSKWCTSVVIPLHKKGDSMRCSNYRGISIIDVALQILESIILKRLVGYREAQARESQSGFRPGRGCIDNIFNLRYTLECHYEYRKPMCVAFLDFKAAFDSVNRNCLWDVLESYGVPEKYIRVFKAIYQDTASTIYVHGAFSDTFSVTQGVKQGAICSPFLFTYAVDWVLHNAINACANDGVGVGVSCGNTCITDLAYADDIALLADNENSLQHFTQKVRNFGQIIGLTLNVAKCKKN
jgi:hypothetical protein